MTAIDSSPASLIAGISVQGEVNTAEDRVLDQIRHSIRQGHPQIRPQGINTDVVAIVGGGPSLNDTVHELRDLIFDGAKVVALNNAYGWCIEHNIRPSAHLMVDARAENAAFVGPVVKGCNYLYASQCHPKVWEAVAGRPNVWIWHAVDDTQTSLVAELNDYYLGQWFGVAGGTTVALRAINVLRACGYLRMHLFGIDSCHAGAAHHAYPQAINNSDKRIRFTVEPEGRRDLARVFTCAPWHVKQFDDFLKTIKNNGHLYKLNIHGDGLLAYALRHIGSSLTYSAQEEGK